MTLARATVSNRAADVRAALLRADVNRDGKLSAREQGQATALVKGPQDAAIREAFKQARLSSGFVSVAKARGLVTLALSRALSADGNRNGVSAGERAKLTGPIARALTRGALDSGGVNAPKPTGNVGTFGPKAARLAAAVESMPAFPKSVQSILAMTRHVDCAPKDLVEVMGKDPVITIKVLRVVNSAYYNLSCQITSMDHAVVFLGFNTIKNLALSIAAISMLPAKHLTGFDAQQYLLHSLVTAGIAKRLALRVQGADPNDCFIAGLLHDFGKVVVAQCMPAEYQRAVELSLWNETSLHAALRQVVGCLLYTSPSPRDRTRYRMPSSA